MSSSPTTPTRARSSEATRQAMLSAAHTRFLKESYENVGMRDIARDVGVDVALVSRYFGSKEELFREVLGVARKKEILPDGLTTDEIPAYLTQMFIEEGGDDNEHVERMLILLRSASSPVASQIVRDALQKDVLQPLAERLGGDSPEAKASTIMAVWMGMTIMRTVISVEPLCAKDCKIEQRLRHLFQAAVAT